MRSFMQAKACIKQNFWNVLIVSALSDMSDFNMIFQGFCYYNIQAFWNLVGLYKCISDFQVMKGFLFD